MLYFRGAVMRAAGGGHRARLDFAKIADGLRRSRESWLLMLFPAGRIRSGTFYIGDATGKAGDSFSIPLDGSKPGLTDFGGDFKGDDLALWAAGTQQSLIDAARDAANWLGMETGPASTRRSRSAPPPPPPETEKPKANGPTSDHAVAMWAGTVPLAGTQAARYLVETRGVPAEALAGLDGVARYHPAYRSSAVAKAAGPALVVAATDLGGRVQAIQAIRLTATGRKAAGMSKLSSGPQGGAAVRLQGIGAPILIDGSEKGIVAWAATGRPVLIALGSIGKIAGQVPDETDVTVSRDHDKKPEQIAAFDSVCAALDARGCVVSIATPPTYADMGKVDWDDVALREGIAAVATYISAAEPWVAPDEQPAPGCAGACGGTKAAPQPVTPISPGPDPDAPSVDDARRMLDTFMGEFCDAVFDFGAARKQFKADAARRNDVEFDVVADLNGDDQPPLGNLAGIARPLVPQHAIRAVTALGKSSAARRLIKKLRGQFPKQPVVFLCPTIDLCTEAAASARKGGLRAVVILGRDAPRHGGAEGEIMCSDPNNAPDDAKNSIEGVQKKVCINGELRCEYFSVCPYQMQRLEASGADVVFMAHNHLFHDMPEFLGTPSAIIIDESFWQTGTKDHEQSVLCDVLKRERDVPGSGGSRNDAASNDLFVYNIKLEKAIKSCVGGPLTLAALEEAGITAAIAGHAWSLWWRTKMNSGILPGIPVKTRKDRRGKVEQNNKLVSKYARAWWIVKYLLDNGGNSTAWIYCDNIDDDGRSPGAFMIYREEVCEDWCEVPTLVLDATLRTTLVKSFIPHIIIKSIPYPKTPHCKIVQTLGAPITLDKLGLGDGKRDNGDKPVQTLRSIYWHIVIKASLYRRVLVVCQMELEKSLRKMGLPPNVEIAHFNATRGIDRWGPQHDDDGNMIDTGVDYALIIGRTILPVEGSERLGEAVTGAPMTARPRPWYPRTIGGSEFHPDPNAEVCRWSVCEGELVQVIGRPRGINRTAENPVLIEVMNDVVLPVPVDETRRWAAPTYAEMMLARGVVPSDWPGRAQVVSDMISGSDPGHALRQAAQRAPAEWVAVECVTNAYIHNSYIGMRDTFAAYSYRLADSRKGATVHISDRHLYPGLAAVAFLGPLDLSRWAPVQPSQAALVTGAMSATIASFNCSATGIVGTTATLSVTLLPFTAIAFTTLVSGFVTATVGSFSASGAGFVGAIGSADAAIDDFIANSNSDGWPADGPGDGIVRLDIPFDHPAASTMPMGGFTATATGAVGVTGQVTAAMPPFSPRKRPYISPSDIGMVSWVGTVAFIDGHEVGRIGVCGMFVPWFQYSFDDFWWMGRRSADTWHRWTPAFSETKCCDAAS